MLLSFLTFSSHSCEDKKNCHNFRAEISYDGVEQLTVQLTNGTPPFIYTWENGLGSGSIALIPGPGTYQVSVEDLNNCIAIAKFTVQ